MPKSPEVRSSGVEWDGANLVLFAPPAITGLASAAVPGEGKLVPFDAYLEAMFVKVLTAASVATQLVDLGNETNDDAFIDGLNITASVAGFSRVDLTGTAIITRAVPAGTVLTPQLTANGTAVVSVALVLAPARAS